MKLDFEKLKQLERDSSVELFNTVGGGSIPTPKSFNIIEDAARNWMYSTNDNEYQKAEKILLELGILIEESHENIVKPFSMTSRGN